MKHTSGPWSAECALSSDLYNIRYITGPDCQKICDVNHRVEMPQDEALANARLIAAAPDLMQALERVLKDGCLDPRLLCVLQANQALAAAKGE
jgi:hypothetical protein